MQYDFRTGSARSVACAAVRRLASRIMTGNPPALRQTGSFGGTGHGIIIESACAGVS